MSRNVKVEAAVAQGQAALTAARVKQARLDLRDQERAAYSISSAINTMVDLARGGRRTPSLELEVSDELERLSPRKEGNLIIPYWALCRAPLTTSGETTGSYLVDTKPAIESLVLALHGRSVVATLPVASLPGCTGNVTLPAETVGPTPEVQSTQTTEATPSTPTLVAVTMTPKDLIALVPLSHRWALQTGPAGDAYARGSLLAATGAQLDALAIAGSGTEGEPLGLVNQITGSVSGTSLDEADVREFQTDIGSALGPDCAFVATQTVASLLNGRQRFTGSSTTLWEGNVYQGQLGGWPAYSAPSVPTGHLLFGAWSNFVVAEWGPGIELSLNPYADFARGGTSLRAVVSFDVGLRRPAAFSKATSVT